jgi:hypothetical protein
MSHVTSLLVGVLFSATVIVKSLLFPGAVISNGDFFFDFTNGNSNPTTYVGSGSVETWAGGNQVMGGGIRLTASGSRNLVANWQMPTKFYSGAVLEVARMECNGTPNAVSGSLVINQPSLKQPPSVGTTIRNQVRLFTGSLTTMNTGALLNTKLLPNQYVSFITNSSGGAVFSQANTDCVMKLQIHEKYGR